MMGTIGLVYLIVCVSRIGVDLCIPDINPSFLSDRYTGAARPTPIFQWCRVGGLSSRLATQWGGEVGSRVLPYCNAGTVESRVLPDIPHLSVRVRGNFAWRTEVIPRSLLELRISASVKLHF